MLKILNFYSLNDEIYLLTGVDKKTKQKRYKYYALRLENKKTGRLSESTFIIDKNISKMVHIKKGYEAVLSVIVDRKSYIEGRHADLIVDAKERLLEYLNAKTRAEKRYFRGLLSDIAIASISLYNPYRGSYYTIRDFAREMGFKDFTKLYKWVYEAYTSVLKPSNYHELKKSSEKTIENQLKNYAIYRRSLMGFYKPLTDAIIRDENILRKELIDRKSIIK